MRAGIEDLSLGEMACIYAPCWCLVVWLAVAIEDNDSRILGVARARRPKLLNLHSNKSFGLDIIVKRGNAGIR